MSWGRLLPLRSVLGAGGQALGLERAGFKHVALVEIDAAACATLRYNRPLWSVFEEDARFFDGQPYRGADLLAGGIPCPPFSVAGRQLGREDERDLFPTVLRLVKEINPHAVMVENVRGLLESRFESYRSEISAALSYLGYQANWTLLQASDFGLPQLRPRALMVALRKRIAGSFAWPEPEPSLPPTVGDTLFDLMADGGWPGAESWRAGRGRHRANHRRRLAQARRAGPRTRAGATRLGQPGGRWDWYRGRGPRPRPRGSAEAHDADGCTAPRLPRRLEICRAQDYSLPAGGQRLSSASSSSRR